MLLNTFFKIIDIQSAEKHAVQIEINPTHAIFEGHFPNNPITPGVCLTQMVKECLEQITKKQLRMITGDNLKFTAILNPIVHPRATVTITIKNKENETIHIDSTITCEEISFFSMKASFKEIQ